tara:strand:- start:1771 stop:2094 length:324 start_codon:yes stop_codon:yes gene_type:complete
MTRTSAIAIALFLATSAVGEVLGGPVGEFAFEGRGVFPTCGPTGDIHSTLTQKGPLKIMSRLDSRHAVNVYIDKEGDWALVLVRTDGTSCLIQTGINWAVEPTGEGV